MPTASDLVTDLPADFETFGQAVATSMADLLGGTTGQILSKASNTDMDFTWITNDVGDITAVTAGTGISGGGTSGAVTITNSMATEISAKGDLIVGTGSQTFDNLTAGANDLVLSAASGETTGLKYAGAWTTWTPSYTDMTVGNATVTARYSQIAKVVFFDFKIIWGSTTSITGGNPTFSLPKASVSPVFFFDGNIFDSGVQNYSGGGQVVGGTSLVYMKVYNVAGAYPVPGAIGTTTPMTWTTNDEYQLHGFYEVA
jgi:hypothetical protein